MKTIPTPPGGVCLRAFSTIRRSVLCISGWLLACGAHADVQYRWSTLAGMAKTSGSADGTGSTARFYNPFGVAVDGSGNVYVGDWGNCTVRKITPAGVVSTYAGKAGQAGSTNGTSDVARFGARVPVDATVRSIGPRGVAVDGSGNVYVADQNQTLRKITPAGMVSTVAGVAGTVGGPFSGISGVAVRGSGNIYISDEGGNFINQMTPSGVMSSFAGLKGYSGWDDGTGTSARFNHPTSTAVDGSGNVYVADTYNDTIRKISAAGVVATYAGGIKGSLDGTVTGDFITDPEFNLPYGVAADASGNVFVADGYNHTIRKITPARVVTTIGGKALTAGTADGIGNTARFSSPHGVAVDALGNVFVSDFINHTIRKGTPIDGIAVAAPDGSALISSSNVNCGLVKTGAGSTQSFTIQNTGLSNLVISSISFSGGHSGDFSVITPPASPIVAGASSTFTIQFAPGATGTRATTMAIDSNASITTHFTIALTGQGTTAVPAELTSPVPGTKLGSTTVTFTWSAGVNVPQYHLSVGTQSGSHNVYDADQGASLSHTVAGLPADGSPVFVTLSSMIDGSWVPTEYAFTATTNPSLPGTLAVLHTFSDLGAPLGTNGKNTDGHSPEGDLVQGADGTFYGTTHFGGAGREGTVFKMNATGTITTLHSFTTLGSALPHTNADGSNPHGGVVFGNDGYLYGTAFYGGTFGGGTVFRISTSGSFSVLHHFSARSGETNSDGWYPSAKLVKGKDGHLYGVAGYGGSGGQGTLFKITTAGVFTTLHSFGTIDANNINSDGAQPATELTQASDGTFYGTTWTGGTSGKGTVFKLVTNGTAAGSTLTTLHSFTALDSNKKNADGATPWSAVRLGGDGALYGTTTAGGTGATGTVYRLTTSGVFTTLYSFSAFTGKTVITPKLDVNVEGAWPSGALLRASDGALYGVADAGGNGGTGSVFRLTTDGTAAGTTYTTLKVFSGFTGTSSVTSLGVNADGAHPFAGLMQGSDGNLYGSTVGGGAHGGGTIFKLPLAGSTSGSVVVNLSPSSLTNAQWRLDGGPWQASGAILIGVSTGTHTLTFKSLSGWTSPATQTVTITANKTILINASYTAPLLSVQQAGKSLVSGLSAIDFGGVLRMQAATPRTITLKNAGQAALTGLTASIDGPESTDFGIHQAPAISLSPGASTTMSLDFLPAAVDARQAVLHLASNDPAMPVFDVLLTGAGMLMPQVLTPPASTLVAVGDAVNLTSTASGGALTYQWLRNKSPVSNAKSANFSFTAAIANAGAYTVKATNGISSSTSAVANVGVVSTLPVSVIVAEGGTLSLTVSASAPGIQYEWRKHGLKLNNGTNPVNSTSTISGATAAKLSITKAISADADAYTCNITMPDPQNLAMPLQKLSGTFTVKVALLPMMNALTAPQWIVGGTVTDVASATNEPASFKLTGQPTGVTIDASGHFHGKPLVAIKVPTVYHLVITASNAKGTSVPLKVDATVQPLNADVAGSYTGPVAPSPELNANLGGSISPIIALTGAITGTLKLGGSSYSLAGQLDSYNSGNPTANFAVGGLTVSFMVDAANHRLKFCDITDGTHHASFSAWRNRWGTTMTQPEKDALNRFLGYHTFALKADPGQTTMPQGAGYGSFTVASNGTLTAAGKLADNTSFTCATFCGPAGEVLIFQQLYSSKGSIAGELDITPGTAGFTPPYGDNTLAGGVSWGRPAIAGRLYASGFISNALTAVGGRYVAPSAPQLALGVLDDGMHTNATLSFSAADIVNASPGISFRFKTGSVFVPPTAANNPRGTSVTVKPTTGTFTGSFTLSDPNGIVGTATRPAPFSGQIVRDTDSVLRGHGFYLLADLPQIAGDTVNNTKQQSGKVVLEPLPRVVLNSETSYHNFKESGLVAQSIPTEVNWVAARAYGNFFGDGSLGLFTARTTYNSGLPIAQATESEFVFWHRQLDGSFVRDTTLLSSNAGGCLHPRKAIVADFNGDGRPDIFVAAHGYDANPFPGERCRVVLSQPGGTYAAADAATDVGFFHSAATADVNNDGKVDVIAMRAGFSTQVVFLNQGNGTFVKEADGRLPAFIHGKNYFTVELADVDGDGIPDLIVGGHEWEGALTRVYRNPGNYNFSSVTPTTIPAVSGEGVVLDFTITGTGATRTLWMLRTSGGDGTFYQSRTIQKVLWSSLSSSLALHDRPASWMQWLIPALSGLQKGVGSDDAGLGVWVAE